MKKFVALLIIVAGGIFTCPDVASLKTALFAVAVACLISGSFVLVLGHNKDWGICPDLDFREHLARALETPNSCAEVIKGFLIFLGLIILAIMKGQ